MKSVSPSFVFLASQLFFSAVETCSAQASERYDAENMSCFGGDIALSLDGSSVVFRPAGGQIVHFSKDDGASWQPAKVARSEEPFIVSWTKLDGFEGTGVRLLAADRQVYGGVFLGEGGSGSRYGRPTN